MSPHTLTLYLLLIFSPAGFTQTPVFMTQLGQFHGDEVNIQNKETVYALFVDGEKSELKKDKIKIALVKDEVLDQEKERTGKLVSLPQQKSETTRTPLIVLKGDVFKEGKVDSIPFDPLRCFGEANDSVKPSSKTKSEKRSCSVSLGKKKYTIEIVHQESQDVEGETVSKYDFAIKGDNDTVTVKGARQIVWMGDLDRDGKIDLLIEDGFHYNVITSLKLFLSTSKPGKPAASFQSVGC